MGVKSNGVLDCECQSEQTEGDGLERRKRKSARTEKGRACDGLLWIFSRLLCSICYRVVWLASWRVSPDFKRIQAPAFHPPLYMLRNRFWDWIRANPLYSCHGDQGTNADKVCVRVRFFSRQIGSMKQTACMRATFRAEWQRNFLCVCVCVCVCHERSDSDWECLSSRAPAGVLHLPIPSLRRWGRIELGCQLREGWAAAGAATNNLSLSLDGYKRLRWLSLQKQEHVQSDGGINHAASDVEQRHLGSGDTVSPEYKNTCSTEAPDATFRGAKYWLLLLTCMPLKLHMIFSITWIVLAVILLIKQTVEGSFLVKTKDSSFSWI